MIDDPPHREPMRAECCPRAIFRLTMLLGGCAGPRSERVAGGGQAGGLRCAESGRG